MFKNLKIPKKSAKFPKKIYEKLRTGFLARLGAPLLVHGGRHPVHRGGHARGGDAEGAGPAGTRRSGAEADSAATPTTRHGGGGAGGGTVLPGQT